MPTATKTSKATEKPLYGQFFESYQQAETATAPAARYSFKIAESAEEIESALRLRFEVFNVELGCQNQTENSSGLEFDEYDAASEHLIIVDNATRETVGTYRLNSLETVKAARNFYSYEEFSIEDLPPEFLASAIEIGRACVAREQRNSRVLLLLWKGLVSYLMRKHKRYFFGCCSVFTQNRQIGGQIFCSLVRDGFLHETLRVNPRADKSCLEDDDYLINYQPLELPNLFKIYLKSGAKICGAPTIDREFGTIDFFVVFDMQSITYKYQKLLLN